MTVETSISKVVTGNSTRRAIVIAAVAVLSLQPGCSVSEWFTQKISPAPPRVLMSDATPEQILEHINNERARLVGWRSNDVRIKAKGNLLPSPSLSAKLSVESPRNLRFAARSIRGTEVDFGSNNDRFWFWTRMEQPDIVLTGSHEGLSRQPNVPIPFPPEWLMDSLGVLPIDPSTIQVMRDPDSPDFAKLVSTDFVQGEQVQRVMLVDLPLGQIVEQSMYNAKGQLIVRAVLADFRQTPEGVTLPHQITLDCTQAKGRMEMTIGSVEVNPQFSDATWQMQMAPGLKLMDLDQTYGMSVRQ